MTWQRRSVMHHDSNLIRAETLTSIRHSFLTTGRGHFDLVLLNSPILQLFESYTFVHNNHFAKIKELKISLTGLCSSWRSFCMRTGEKISVIVLKQKRKEYKIKISNLLNTKIPPESEENKR